MKKRGGGKAKGSAFERKIAKTLSLWLTGGKDSKQLIRSVLSGGWQGRGSRASGDWRQVGDLAPNGPAGELFRRTFGVECKHHRVIEVGDVWTREADGTINAWWKKLVAECKPYDVVPLLIFHANNAPIMVVLPEDRGKGLPEVAFFPWRGFCIMPFTQFLAKGAEWVVGAPIPEVPAEKRRAVRRKRPTT